MSNELRIGAAYIRVSTDDQLELSPDSQLAEIRKYCAQHSILLSSDHIFIEEEGKSGRKSENRAAFQHMIAVSKEKPKPFDVILIWKFARFARNQEESTFYKSLLRKKLGIDVVSISEPIMEGMYGRLIETIIEWQDEFYSINLSNEVKRSMRYKAEKGLYNSRMPLGYYKEPGDSIPVINEVEAHIVRTIFKMFTTGYDKGYITKYLNDKGFHTRSGKQFDGDTVSYILENPFYIGKVRWNRRESSSSNKLKAESEWIISDSKHEPIIDMDTWDAAQRKISLLRQSREAYAHPVSHTKHWLSSIVKCPYCGKSLSYKHGYPNKTNNTTNSSGFQCLGYRRGLHSESQFISERKLIASVLQSLEYAISPSNPAASFELINTQYSNSELQAKLYTNELDSLRKKEERIKEAYMNEIDSLEEYKHNKLMIAKRREELLALIQDLTKVSGRPEDYRAQFLSKVSDVLCILKDDNAPYEIKGEAIRSIIKKIILHKDTNTLEVFYYLSI